MEPPENRPGAPGGGADGIETADQRMQALLEAVLAVAGGLDRRATLQHIVEAAARLVGARYVALGVLNPAGDGLVDFVTHGLTDEQRELIGPPPLSHGVLGLLISDGKPIRLHDVSQHPAAYGVPPHHPLMHTFLGVPIRVGDQMFGNLYLSEKENGQDFTEDDEQVIVALAAAAGVSVDNARLYEQMRQRERWVTATADIQQLLLRRVDRADALAQVAAHAREVAGAELAAVVLEQDDGSLRVEAVEGTTRHRLYGRSLPRQGALLDVVAHGATVHLSEGVELAGLEDVVSAMLVPLTGPGGAGGALLVGSTTPQGNRWREDDDLKALRGFAAQVALALDRAQAEQDRSALAVLADRDRIARDLHDLVIQRLFATGLRLQGAKRNVDHPRVSDALQDAITELDQTIRDIRGTIFELANPRHGEDLRGQIRATVAAAAEVLGYQPRLALSGPLDTAVPDPVRPHLLAVLGEALSNAARHAEAGQVEVRVGIEDTAQGTAVVATVTDDGKGIGLTGRQSGLRNLHERAAAVGGDCTIESASGEGTTVRWEAPV